MSLPSRERGLKSIEKQTDIIERMVAPLAGAWIEISYVEDLLEPGDVAPLAGAWIEII